MSGIIESIINVLMNGSVVEQIGVISGLLAIAGAIGWVAKVTVGRLIFVADPAPAAPGGVVITPELLDEIIQKRVREALARDTPPGGDGMQPQPGDAQGLIRDAEAGLEDVAREGADGAAAVERFIKTGETARAKELLRKLAEQDAAEGASANARAAERFRQLGALAFLDNTQEAMAAYAKAVELDPDDPEGWNRLGQLQLRTGALDAATNSFERVLALGNKAGRKDVEAAATGNLGAIYMTRGELDRAEAMFKRDLEVSTELGSKEGMAASYGNLGLIYRRRGELDRAEAMFLKSLEIEKELGRKEGMAADYGNLGLIYMTRGELDRAEDMHLKSLEIEKELGRKEGMAADYGNLGSLYQQRGDTARACAHWRRARDLFREIGMAPQVEQTEALMRDAGCPQD